MDEFENNPLIFAIYNKNNIELIKLMTNYVNKKKIRSKWKNLIKEIIHFYILMRKIVMK